MEKSFTMFEQTIFVSKPLIDIGRQRSTIFFFLQNINNLF